MAIDISRLPKPTLIEVDADKTLAERIASLKARYTAAGIAWTVEALKTDPGWQQQNEDNMRQTIDRVAINDMAVARTLGFARGGDLDRLATTFYADVPDIGRLPGELDDRYERRILVAGQALAGALTEGGIVYHALSTDVRVIDAVAWHVRPGKVQCAILVEAGAPAGAILSAVATRLRQPRNKGTAEVAVSLAYRVERQIAIRLQHGQGPDPAMLRTAALTQLGDLAARVGSRIGTRLTTDEIIAEGRVGGTSKLILDAPVVDLDPGQGGVLAITAIDVRMEMRR